MALYYQNKIKNSKELDEALRLMDFEEGIEMSTEWFKKADPVDEDAKMVQSEIVESIKQLILQISIAEII